MGYHGLQAVVQEQTFGFSQNKNINGKEIYPNKHKKLNASFCCSF